MGGGGGSMEKAVYPRKIQLKVQNLFTPSHFPNSSSGPDWSFCLRFDTLVYSQDETKLQRDEYYIKSGNPYLLSLLVPAHTLLVDMKLQPAAVASC